MGEVELTYFVVSLSLSCSRFHDLGGKEGGHRRIHLDGRMKANEGIQ